MDSDCVAAVELEEEPDEVLDEEPDGVDDDLVFVEVVLALLPVLVGDAVLEPVEVAVEAELSPVVDATVLEDSTTN